MQLSFIIKFMREDIFFDILVRKNKNIFTHFFHYDDRYQEIVDPCPHQKPLRSPPLNNTRTYISLILVSRDI
jgi:hypothetical protein